MRGLLGRNPRVASALLWGAVGFMAFLVLVQSYALAVEPLLTIAQSVLLAVVVGFATAVGAYVLEHRIAEWSTRRTRDETESQGGDGKSKS